MNRPDLRWLQDQLAAEGLSFSPIRGESFACQCPVHRGDGQSARFSLRNGMLLFTCYAYGCSFRDVREVLDLTEGDVYEERILRDRKREIQRRAHINNDHDRHFIAVAESDLRAGKRLSQNDMERYQVALLKQRGAA